MARGWDLRCPVKDPQTPSAAQAQGIIKGREKVAGMTLDFGRRLDLSLAHDRRHLLTVLNNRENADPVDSRTLDDYLFWFQDNKWRQVHSNGWVGGPDHSIRTIDHLLTWTQRLQLLSDCIGFGTLISSLKNPSQVRSTLFEINVGVWLLGRRASRQLIISPEISRDGCPKHPDFRWLSNLADCYVECKQTKAFESDAERRVRLANSLVTRVLGATTVPPHLRLEVTIRHYLNDLERTLRKVLCPEGQGFEPTTESLLFTNEHVTVRLCQRGPLEVAPGFVCQSNVTVGTTPTRLDDGSNVHLAVSLDVRKERARVVRHNIKTACRQLPRSEPSIIAIDSAGRTEVEEVCTRGVSGSRNADIRMVQLWNGSGGPRWAVHRDDQEIDARALQ
jgi:hypothetical protein